MTLRRSVRSFLALITLLSVLLPSSWAQSPSNGKPQTQRTTVKSPSRVPAADITARLQSQAVADAVAVPHMQSAVMPGPTRAPAMAAPLVSSAATEALPGVLPVVQQTAEVTQTPPAEHPFHQELLIAQQIHVGRLPCELGATVRIEADAAQPGYFHVHAKGLKYRMFPVQTSTGALRLEDKKAGAVWLQLANKSMLMDQKRGRRLADECAHPDQLAVAQSMKTNPPPSLIDTQGMGR